MYKPQDTDVKEFPTDENGRVCINAGMINHRCSNKLKVIECISKYGVLANEWFGILESELEGGVCAFVSRMKKENYPYIGDLIEDNFSILNTGSNVILFFDDSNPVMKCLLHLGYFEYEDIKRKKQNSYKNYVLKKRFRYLII